MARKAGATNTRGGKPKVSKNVSVGVAHIQSTFNNTIITLTDTKGDALSWASAGSVNFKGTKKGTPFAAQLAAEAAARRAQEHGLKRVDVHVKGPGSGRESAITALQSAGMAVKRGCSSVRPKLSETITGRS